MHARDGRADSEDDVYRRTSSALPDSSICVTNLCSFRSRDFASNSFSLYTPSMLSTYIRCTYKCRYR